MTDLPQPLTPADCDLRGLPYMPLDVIRLLDSDMFAEATGDEFKAAVALWCKSWTQVPAASLPNKDKVLAHLSGNAERWKRIKTGAMRGWILCSDDRWYHPVVAEKVLAALPGREEFNSKKSAEAERKSRERDDRKALFEALKGHGIVPDWNVSTKVLRGMATQYMSQEPPEHVTDVARDMSQGVTVSKGEGEKKGEGELTSKAEGDDGSTEVGVSPPSTRIGEICRLLRKAGINTGPAALSQHAWPTNPAATNELIETALAIAKQNKPNSTFSVNYLRPIVDELLNPPAAKPSKPKSDDWEWKRSDGGIERKGREMGMFARGGESHRDFAGRIDDEIRKRKGKP